MRAVWDEHRNTSRVFPVPPNALAEALEALQRIDPRLRAWIEAGAPRLTHEEHFERFGELYAPSSRRRR
jgi:hypothetical protein